MISICFSFCSGKVLTLMTIWMTGKKINGTFLPKKEGFYSHRNMEVYY